MLNMPKSASACSTRKAVTAILEIDPFWQTQPMQCCKGVRDVVMMTQSIHHRAAALRTDCWDVAIAYEWTCTIHDFGLISLELEAIRAHPT